MPILHIRDRQSSGRAAQSPSSLCRRKAEARHARPFANRHDNVNGVAKIDDRAATVGGLLGDRRHGFSSVSGGVKISVPPRLIWSRPISNLYYPGPAFANARNAGRITRA